MKNILILGILAGVVLLMVQFPHTMLSPGELVQGHQDLNNNCFACHAPFGGIPNDKCIACHQLSEIGKAPIGDSNLIAGKSPVLFHESLSSQSCTACHTDHKGIDAEMQLKGFQHGLLSESVINQCVSCHAKPVDNLHQQLSTNCKQCHNIEGWKTGVTFNHDMLLAADKTNCVACHLKPKDNFHSSLKDNCSQCHSTEKWVPASFDHAQYFVLDGDHNASCNTCHKNNNYDTYTCYGCHEHTINNILAEHNEEGIYNINNCVACHRSGDEDDAERGQDGNGENRSQRKEGNRKKEDDDD